MSTVTPKSDPLKFDSWCLLEIMGHQKFAGRVTEETIAGSAFLRIDIPARADGTPAFTKFFSPSSVYSFTPMAEDLVRGIAAELRNAPIAAYDLPAEMRAKLMEKPAIADMRNEDDDYDDMDYDEPY